MRPTVYVLLLAMLLNACGSMPNITKNVTQNTPNIGAIGVNKTTLLKTEFTKIGEPNLAKPLELSLKAVPFNKSVFKAYTTYKARKGETPTTVYVDSLSIKPKYYTLTLTDHIGLKSELNDVSNNAVLNYLETDRQYGVITQVTFVTNSSFEEWVDNADNFYITEHRNHLRLEFKSSLQSQFLDFEQLEIFDYEFSTFCWKENMYGKPEIAVISVNGGFCPKNTEKDAVKLNNTKSYLKF